MKEKKFEERKHMIYRLLCDDLYVPMRTKEIAMLLDIPKSKRESLQEVLDIEKRKIPKGRKYHKRGRLYQPCQRFWLCACGK